MASNMETAERERREDVPGGRCYWCASQDHDSDDCAEALRIMDGCRDKYLAAEAEAM